MPMRNSVSASSNRFSARHCGVGPIRICGSGAAEGLSRVYRSSRVRPGQTGASAWSTAQNAHMLPALACTVRRVPRPITALAPTSSSNVCSALLSTTWPACTTSVSLWGKSSITASPLNGTRPADTPSSPSQASWRLSPNGSSALRAPVLKAVATRLPSARANSRIRGDDMGSAPGGKSADRLGDQGNLRDGVDVLEASLFEPVTEAAGDGDVDAYKGVRHLGEQRGDQMLGLLDGFGHHRADAAAATKWPQQGKAAQLAVALNAHSVLHLQVTQYLAPVQAAGGFGQREQAGVIIGVQGAAAFAVGQRRQGGHQRLALMLLHPSEFDKPLAGV